MKPVYELKPERFPFLFYTIIKRLIVLLILAGIVSFFTWWAWPVAAVLTILMVIWRGARYRKEHYQFFSDRIVVRTGSVFSDNKTELVLGRVTHVKHRRPWLESAFFGTGHIQIQSAGSAGTEAALRSIAHSEKVYVYVEQVLQKNGFSLQKDELLTEASPNAVAVLLDIAGIYFFLFMFLFALVGPWILGELAGVASEYSGFVALGGFLVVLLLLATAVLRFLDLSRRRYRVYSDTITYEEGFLTKVYSFLPAENLSDSATKQSFIGQILGLYDITISVQGSGGETRFSNLREGKEVDAAIDKIIDAHGDTVTGAAKKSSASVAKKSAAKPARKEQKVRATLEGTFKPQLVRCLIPAFFFMLPVLLVLPFLFFLALGLIPAFIAIFARYMVRYLAESYTVQDGRIVYAYHFLRTKRVEFTADKITEVEFHKGIIDRFTGTVTVKVKSIGSGQNITLFGVDDTPELRQSVLSVDNVEETPAIKEYPSRFSAWTGLVELGPVLWLIVLVFAGISTYFFIVESPVLGGVTLFVLVAFLIALLIGFFLRYRDASLSLHEAYVRYEYGWIGKNTHYARYDAVKSVDATRYWRAHTGAVEVDIAGEETPDQGVNERQNIGRPQKFTARFIAEAWKVQNDVLMRCGASKQSTELVSAKPLARNSLPIFLILFPILVLYPFVLWSFSKRSYQVSDDRTEYLRGIFSRRRKVILHAMIDHVRSGQGLLNKIFGNGRVSLYTTGSSNVEMVIGPIRGHAEFARTLEEHYS